MLGDAPDDINAGEDVVEAGRADKGGQNAVIAVDIQRTDALFEQLHVLCDKCFLIFDLILQRGDLILGVLHIDMEILQLGINERQLVADEPDLLIERLLILRLFAEIVRERGKLFFFLVDLLLLFLFLPVDLLDRPGLGRSGRPCGEGRDCCGQSAEQREGSF